MIKLYQKQQEVMDRSWDRGSWAWFHETGTGKTIMTLENMRILYEKKMINVAIICAPKTVIKPVWLVHLEKYEKTMDYYVFTWHGGLSDYNRVALAKQLRKDTEPPVLLIFLINIEAFSYYTKDPIYKRPRGKIYTMMTSLLRRYKVFWAIDQSTMIKEHDSKRTEGIVSLSYLPDFKRILSGYPVLKTPSDLYSQIQFLGPNLIPHQSFYSFRNRYAITKKLDSRVTIEIGTQNLQELNQIIQPFSSRLLKKEMVDLPPKLRTKRIVEMTSEQQKYYKQMKDQAHIILEKSGESTFASNLLVQLEKLHQVANGLIISLNVRMPCRKYDVLIDVIREEIGDNQVIVWFSYIDNILEACERLTQDNISCTTVYGGVTGSRRDNAIMAFMRNEYQVLLANPATAKFGLNLVNAPYAIYFNNSFKLEDRLESEDRIHRIGQDAENILYIDLITEGTNEDKILATLESNHSVGATVMGDEWKQWFQ